MTARQLKEWLRTVDDAHEVKVRVKTTFETEENQQATETELVPLDADGHGWMECVSCGCELATAIVIQDVQGQGTLWLNTTGEHGRDKDGKA